MEEEIQLSFEDDTFDFDEKERQILLCLNTFCVTIKAIRRGGYDKVKYMIWRCASILVQNRGDLESWMQSKSHEEFLRVCDIKTMKCFIAAVRWFVYDYKTTYSTNMETGHYNNNDLLYEVVSGWASILVPRFNEASKWLCGIMEDTKDEMYDSLKKCGREKHQINMEDILIPS